MAKRIKHVKDGVMIRFWSWTDNDADDFSHFNSITEAVEYLAAECTKLSKMYEAANKKMGYISRLTRRHDFDA
jgi:hypothetical protein